jgi:hypothetical protein
VPFQAVTNESGIVKFVRDNVSVEDVIGISANYKLVGIERHPKGIGTFVDRYWCNFDIVAKGYTTLEYESLGNYNYVDKGYIKEGNFQQVEFTIAMHRK